MSKKKAKKQKRKALAGHKKIGSKFIPPMMQIEKIHEVSYLNDALPNLIWMGLIFDHYGYKQGIRLIDCLVSTAYDICKDEKGNFSYLCYYSMLDISKKAEIYRALKSNGILYQLQYAIAPLSCLFRYFPALFLKPDFKIDKTDFIPRLKRTIKEVTDRYSELATAIQVTTLYNSITNGKLHIDSHIEMPDLNSIFTAPDSEEAKRAASFARSNLNGELGFRSDEISKGWVRDFWIQIYKLEDCEPMEIK